MTEPQTHQVRSGPRASGRYPAGRCLSYGSQVETNTSPRCLMTRRPPAGTKCGVKRRRRGRPHVLPENLKHHLKASQPPLKDQHQKNSQLTGTNGSTLHAPPPHPTGGWVQIKTKSCPLHGGRRAYSCRRVLNL